MTKLEAIEKTIAKWRINLDYTLRVRDAMDYNACGLCKMYLICSDAWVCDSSCPAVEDDIPCHETDWYAESSSGGREDRIPATMAILTWLHEIRENEL